MKIIEVKTLAFPEIKIIRFGRFPDNRGYFTEPFRRSDFDNNPQMDFLRGVQFTQVNESFSHKNVIRGMHFQWNPYMGKLVRVIYGHMIDMAIDIRKGSPNFGKIIAYDMETWQNKSESEWIWIPPGFAHGVLFFEDSMIEYFCSGEYSPGCEVGISPLAKDIDWSMCDPKLKNIFDEVAPRFILSDKDKNGLTIEMWERNERSNNFVK